MKNLNSFSMEDSDECSQIINLKFKEAI